MRFDCTPLPRLLVRPLSPQLPPPDPPAGAQGQSPPGTARSTTSPLLFKYTSQPLQLRATALWRRPANTAVDAPNNADENTCTDCVRRGLHKHNTKPPRCLQERQSETRPQAAKRKRTPCWCRSSLPAWRTLKTPPLTSHLRCAPHRCCHPCACSALDRFAAASRLPYEHQSGEGVRPWRSSQGVACQRTSLRPCFARAAAPAALLP